jgi:hypothetical protein
LVYELKKMKMKKIILCAFLVFFSLGAFATAQDLKSKSENPAVPANKENRMSEEETNNLSKRVEEIRSTDNSKQVVVVQEGRRSRRGHDMEGNRRVHGGVIFIGGGSLLLLIILIIILV